MYLCYEIEKDSCELIIEYDDNRRKGGATMSSNNFLHISCYTKYFISENKSKKINIFVSTYEFI